MIYQTNTVYHLHVKSKKAELIKTESRMVLGVWGIKRYCLRVSTCDFQISSGDLVYIIMIIINNAVL